MDLLFVIIGFVMIMGLAYVAIMEWRKGTHESQLFLIETLVAAAQQLYGNDPGAIRYNWVVERVKERWPEIDETQLESLIEAAVYRLKVYAGRLPAESKKPATRGPEWFGQN